MVDNENKLAGEKIFNTPLESQQPSIRLNYLMDTYLQARKNNDQVTAQAAKSLLEDKYIYHNIKHNPAHWSFGERNIYYPNKQLKLETNNIINNQNRTYTLMG